MSNTGIEKIMDKMKSKKLTLEDYPTPNLVLKEDLSSETQQDSITANSFAVHTTSKPDVQQLSKTSEHTNNQSDGHMDVQPASQSAVQHAKTASQQIGETETQQKPNASGLGSALTGREEIPSFSQSKKVTYYFTPEAFKAFNEVYAKRILDGRQTDKSTLICEAVELLYISEINRRS